MGFDVDNILSLRLGVIGGGVIAKSILFPLFDQGLLDPCLVTVSITTQDNLKHWTDRGSKGLVNSNGIVVEECGVVIWAVKPQIFPTAVKSAGNQLLEFRKTKTECFFRHPLHISVMAGITLEQFTEKINESFLHVPKIAGEPHVIRTMPNIGLRVGVGCTVFTLGLHADSKDRDYVQSLFSPNGICLEVGESQINAYGALTGSGVGFMFPILEAFSDGGVKIGLGREISLKMAAQTMKCAAELFLKEGTHPAVLKDSVCSPGGTTIAGIAELERATVRSGIINAIEATHKRSEELGKL